ncbi:MAG: hypothetical protein JW940_35880, partial [Polyangiaceae bacterium]|nr:hypothetical protein [Polyangiaceae bacterium]
PGAAGYPQQPGYGQQPGQAGQQPAGYAQPSGPGVRPQPGYDQALGAGSGATQAKPIQALLSEAFDLYRKHIVALVLICIVLFIPFSAVPVVARWIVMAPTAALVDASVQGMDSAAQAAAADMQRALAEPDPAKRAELLAKQQQHATQLVQASRVGVAAAATGLAGSVLLAGLVFLEAFVLMCFIFPLTQGAVTAAVMDGATGGQVSPGRAFSLVFRRVGGLLVTGFLSALAVTIGSCLCVLPGLALAFVFALSVPVVMFEHKSGVAALKRSYELVKFDWVYVLVVLVVFGVIYGVVSSVAQLAFGWTGMLIGGMASSVIQAVLYPFSAIATVLAYIEIRRRKEGAGLAQLRAELDGARV